MRDDENPAAPLFRIGDEVTITLGLARGIRGVILERWPRDYGSVALWRVGTRDTVHTRVIRGDHLRLEKAAQPRVTS